MRASGRLAALIISALCIALFTCSANSQNRFAAGRFKPFDGGKADALGLIVRQARERAIEILQAQNSCSAWFRETDPQALDAFESLEFVLDDGPKYIQEFKSSSGEIFLKHPYCASTYENAGRNAIVLLNVNGPFFVRAADIFGRQGNGGFLRYAGRRLLTVGSFAGDTLPAQITTLLHEFGHAIGRLPDDSGGDTGLSVQNTERVLRACRSAIKENERQHRR